MRRNKIVDFLFRKQYVIAGCLVFCAGLGMTALYNYNQEQERQQLEREIAQLEEEQYVAEETQMEEVTSVIPPKEVAENYIVEEPIVLAEPKEPAEETVPEEPVKSVTSAAPVLQFDGESGLLWPMDGNVIMNYSMDATIYHATLDQYKYNPAIIISGAVNNEVFSVAKGKITEITQNEVTGTTVTVDLGDGYEAIYGQLKELNFDEGDYLESGHVIGYVSEPTKYYSVEGSNLYFAMRKDGKPVDPILFFE